MKENDDLVVKIIQICILGFFLILGIIIFGLFVIK